MAKVKMPESSGTGEIKLPDILNPPQMCALLQVSRWQLGKLMERGIIPYLRLGGRRYSFIRDDVISSLRRHQHNAPQS